MKHSIKFAVIYLCGHVCMQSPILWTENNTELYNLMMTGAWAW